MNREFHFPKEIFDLIIEYIRLIPTLQTIKNWRDSNLRFDINELNCAYKRTFNDEHVIMRKNRSCNLHNYDLIMYNPIYACSCTNSHIVRTYFKPILIWNNNYLALWKSTTKGNKLIWHYVDIIECDSCGELHISYHITKIEERNICKLCIETNLYN